MIGVRTSVLNFGNWSLKEVGEILARRRPENMERATDKVKDCILLITIHKVAVTKSIPHKIKEKYNCYWHLETGEMEMCRFDILWLPAHICFWLFARPGHINFHSDIIIIIIINLWNTSPGFCNLVTRKWIVGGKCRLIARCSEHATFSFSPSVSRDDATSVGFSFNTSTVVYTWKKFRWSYSGSQGVTGSPFVSDYDSRRLPGRGINLPWNNTLHNNSKELVSVLVLGCTPAPRDLPAAPVKLPSSFMRQSQT